MNLNEIKFDEKGLVVAIVQDYFTLEVLMQAYMTKESLEQTLSTKKATFFSRSRNKLWVKGETSGNFQNVKEIFYDCDKDSILLKVEQIGGAACHTGARSCFFTGEYEEKEANLTMLTTVFDLVEDRKKNPTPGSYTNYLFDKGVDKICKKIGEEASEIIIAAKNDSKEEMIYEISDFIYHLTVLMSDKGLTFEDIMKELKKRHLNPPKEKK